MSRNLLFALLAIFVIGVIAWNYIGNNSNLRTPNNGPQIGIGGPGNTSIAPNSSPDPVQIRLSLSSNFVEHGVQATNHLQNLYNGEDTSQTAADLENNSQEVANIIAQIGGGEVREPFLATWRGHIQEYENYTMALKNNDRNGTAQARSMLSTHASEMGMLLNQLIPSISPDRGKELMEEHIDLTLSIIESHARGDETEKAAQGAKASAQAVQFANELVDGLERTESQAI